MLSDTVLERISLVDLLSYTRYNANKARNLISSSPYFNRTVLMYSDKINSISGILNSRKIVKISGDQTNIYAAVMMVIKESGNSLSTLLIKRSTHRNDVFSGHMAFPGGKRKIEDKNKLDTAIRETLEEVGIDLKCNSNILGQLDDCKPYTPAARKFIITPYVAYLEEDKDININEEVSDTIWIPLQEMKNNYLKNINKYKGGKTKEIFEYSYNEYFIWGTYG